MHDPFSVFSVRFSVPLYWKPRTVIVHIDSRSRQNTALMRILITGFPPFPNQPVNPTQLLVESVQHGHLSLSDHDISAVLLPCEYVGVETAFLDAVTSLNPDLVLSFGVGRQTPLFRLETTGVNWDEAQIPDNAGETRLGCPILEDGPPKLFHPWDLVRLGEHLAARGIYHQVSDDAGRYVCNHLNYYGLWQSQKTSSFNFLFTHVSSVENGFVLESALGGVEFMIEWIQTSTNET